MKLSKKKRKLFVFIIVFPLICGILGFLINGESLLSAVYGSFSFYFANVNVQGVNGLIWISRITAPMATATGIILSVSGSLVRFMSSFSSMRNGAVAIYCDSDNIKGRVLADSMRNGILSMRSEEEAEHYWAADKQVIMFNDDWDNLEFYERNYSVLKNRMVYMKLEDTDPALFRGNNVRYFNPNELTASAYWRKRPLFALSNGKKLNVHVVIIGFEAMGRKILDAALINNVYFADQSITYHVFGEDKVYLNLHSDFRTLNGDRIIFHKKPWEKKISMLREMDRIIITKADSSEIVQSLLHLCSSSIEIDFYNPENLNLCNFYKADNLNSFGNIVDVFREMDIDNLDRGVNAKKLNYYMNHREDFSPEHIVCDDIEKEWLHADGETRASYENFMNYNAIYRAERSYLADMGLDITKEEYRSIECVRWSRFHYLNNWKHSVKSDDEIHVFVDELNSGFDEYRKITGSYRNSHDIIDGAHGGVI